MQFNISAIRQIVFLTTLLSSLTSSAQKTEVAAYKAELWKNDAAEFSAMESPEKWKNKSTVILAQHETYENIMGFHLNLYTYSLHTRIKIQDIAGISDYSIFYYQLETGNKDYDLQKKYFNQKEDYTIIGIKVIKSDGSSSEIDYGGAVQEKYHNEIVGLKIPIPNLQVGDIIDIVTKENYDLSKVIIPHSMFYYGRSILLEQISPVVKYQLDITLPNRDSLLFKSFNGAPGFTSVRSEKSSTYTLKDEMRENSIESDWTYPHRTSPEVRFLSVYTRDLNYNYSFSGLMGVLSDETPSGLMKKYANKFIFSGNTPEGIAEDYFTINMKDETDPQKLINELYYLLRNPLYSKMYFDIDADNPLYDYHVGDSYFNIVQVFLNRHKIPYYNLLFPTRKYGPFDDQTFLDGRTYDVVIRTKTPTPIYIPRLTPFGLPNEMNYDIEGTQGISSTTLPKVKNAVSDTVQAFLKPSSKDENVTTTKLDVSISLNDDVLDVKRTVVATGKNKADHQYRIVTNYDYQKEYDLPKYQAQSSNKMRGILEKYNKDREKIEQRKAQDYDQRDKNIKENIENSMDIKVKDYKNFQLKTIGMWQETPNTEYSDEFTSENMIKKAGENYLLELPVLIGKQREVSEEDKKRTAAVYLDFAKTYNTEIIFDIPEGYTVEGLDKLTKNVTNEFGGFTSTATIEGSKLHIKTSKFYSRAYATSWEWPKMIEFLNAAVEFTNTKVLLKKS